MSFQRPSKDPTTWQAWTAHDHTAAAQRLWEMALLEFTGVHTVKVGGLLQEAEVHLCRAKILLTQEQGAAWERWSQRPSPGGPQGWPG